MTLLRPIAASVFAAAFALVGTTGSAIAGQPVTLTLQVVGTAAFPPSVVTTDRTTRPDETDSALNEGDADGAGGSDQDLGVNRTLPGAVTGKGRPISATARAKSRPALNVSVEGLNFFNQRFANGGNQFSVEPPDQALCAGNGFVLESVNDVLRVYRTDGTPATGVVDLNTFYGYPAAIIRSGPDAGKRGPSITDPICIFDQVIGRFVHVVLTLDHVGTTAALNGNTHLDIAVSDTADPTGTWTIYKLPTQNNGTDGTPDHGCALGFCLGDYPHIGADANGIYLTTNEFSTLGPGFYGAQVYGIGHNLLLGGAGSVVLFNSLGMGPDGGGFTVWPAQTPGSQFDTASGGTEYFMSSNAVFSDDGTSTTILVWKMANTASLNSLTPTPTLDVATVAVNSYAVPGLAHQKTGDHPLGQCIADLTIPCNIAIAGTTSHDARALNLNSNDSRMQQVFYANGKLWGALGSAVEVGGQQRAGIAYYVINPHSLNLTLQGQAGIENTDLTYPAVAVTPSGRGVIAFTLTGDNDFPSAAFAGLDAKIGMGEVKTAAAGVGPWDGFTRYRAFGNRPRWGDYGAAVVDGNSIWMASEYVAQTCTYATYLTDPTCGGTRGALGNWSTRITQVTP